jgi:ankyrin repeat protein
MNELSLEMLISIAQYLELADLCRWVLTAKKYRFALKDELCAKALSVDLKRGWPYHLVRAALLNQATNPLPALVQGTSVDSINKANIDLAVIPGEHNWDLLRPSKSLPTGAFMSAPIHTTSLLHIASQLCNEDVLRLILTRGAHPDILDSFAWAPLHLVSWSGKTDIIRILIEAGADVDIQVDGDSQPQMIRTITKHSGTTPLHQAASRGHLAAVDILLRAGAEPKTRCGNECDALGAAAKNGHIEIVQRILETGYDKASLTNGLRFAAEGESASSVEILLQAGAEPHEALRYAVVHDRLDNMRLLIEANGDVRRNDFRGHILNFVRSVEATKMILATAPGLSIAARPGMFHGTPLEALYESAEYLGREKAEEIEGIAMLLIEDGCSIRTPKPIDEDNDRLSFNRNILEDAALWGHLRVIEALLARNRSLLNLQHRFDYSPLFYAALSASHNKFACFKLLVQNGADIHAVNRIGQPIIECLYSMSSQQLGTPLPLQQNAAVTQYLIDLGMDINAAPGRSGPLYHALSLENDPSAMILMKAGADISDKTRAGLSMLQAAVQNGCVESMEYILLQTDGIGNLHASSNGDTLLHIVVTAATLRHKGIKGYVKMMAHILLGHRDISVEDVAGDEAALLKPLAYSGRMEVIRRICERGIVDPGVRNNNKMTPFDWIAYQAQEEVAGLLEEAYGKWPRPESALDILMRRMRVTS